MPCESTKRSSMFEPVPVSTAPRFSGFNLCERTTWGVTRNMISSFITSCVCEEKMYLSRGTSPSPGVPDTEIKSSFSRNRP